MGARLWTVRGWGCGESPQVACKRPGRRREAWSRRDRMWRAEERATQKGQERGDVRRILEERGWDQRVEEEGLNVLGGMRVGEVMTGKCPPNTQED